MRIKLDYSKKDIDDRLNIVQEICDNSDPEDFSHYDLERMANYLIYQMDKDERKKREILTPNRMVTVNKRETSFEGIVSKFETNEDGIYNIMTDDKNVIMSPKVEITEEDIEEIPFLKQIREAIDRYKALPRRNYIVQQAIIDLSQTQYIIKDAYKKTMSFGESRPPKKAPTNWGEVLNFQDKNIVLAFIKYYPILKVETYNEIYSEMYWVLEDFDDLIERALHEEPILMHILQDKFEGRENIQIQKRLKETHENTLSIEYISSLYNNKIPELIAGQAQEDALIYHYTFEEKGRWKTCTQCGQVKLLHSRFFSRNSRSSKDGFYSICKECRNS